MKISIITCTYNQKKFLSEAIESVQKSILSPFTDITFEHLIYDDGSTDGTETIFEKAPANVRYFKNKENKGPSFGRNFLIEQATGDYIFMLDSDDIVLQRTLHNFVDVARKQPDISWFISDFVRSDEELRYEMGQDYYGWHFKSPQAMLESIFKGEFFIQSNVFFKKELWQLAGGFDTSMRMAEDLDLFIRFLIAEHMPSYQPFISHIHRNHDKNLSKDENLTKHIDRMKELRLKYHDKIESNEK